MLNDDWRRFIFILSILGEWLKPETDERPFPRFNSLSPSVDIGDDQDDSEKGLEGAAKDKCLFTCMTPCISPAANFFFVDGLGRLFGMATILLFVDKEDVVFENLCLSGIGFTSGLEILYDSTEAFSSKLAFSSVFLAFLLGK